jgi:hypothetical protein
MAFKAGTASAFYLSNAANALQNLAPYIDNLTLPQSVTTLDVSCFGTNAKAFMPGQSGGDTLSFSGPYDVTVHTHLSTLQSSGSLAGFMYGPGGSVASQARSAGSGYVTQYSVSASVSGRAEYTCSVQTTGAIANGTF